MTYTYEYPRPAVTVDIIIVSLQETPHILLIQRKNQPFAQMWALPGGFLDPEETLEQAAQRELKEETGLNVTNLSQFKTYSTPNRDPRRRTISTVFYKTINIETNMKIKAADDAENTQWFALYNLPQLAFDHNSILREFTKYYSTIKREPEL